MKDCIQLDLEDAARRDLLAALKVKTTIGDVA